MHYVLNIETSNWAYPWFWKPRTFLQTDWKSGLEMALAVGYSRITFKVWRKS